VNLELKMTKMFRKILTMSFAFVVILIMSFATFVVVIPMQEIDSFLLLWLHSLLRQWLLLGANAATAFLPFLSLTALKQPYDTANAYNSHLTASTLNEAYTFLLPQLHCCLATVVVQCRSQQLLQTWSPLCNEMIIVVAIAHACVCFCMRVLAVVQHACVDCLILLPLSWIDCCLFENLFHY